MKVMKNKLIRGMYALLALILLLLIINAAIFPSLLRKDYIFPSNFLSIVGYVGLSIFGIWYFVIPIVKKYNKLTNYLILIILLIIQIVIVTSLQGASGIDDFDIRVQVSSFLAGQKKFSDYFIYGANNIPITLLFTGIGKVVNYIGLNQYLTLILNIIQCLFFDITIISTFFLLRWSNKKVEATLFLFLVTLFLPISIYISYLYTDLISACLSILGLLCFYLSISIKKNNVLFMFGSGILEALAYLIKMNLVIMTIGIVIIGLLEIKNWKKLVKTFSIFIISFLLIAIPYNLSLNRIDHFSPQQINRSSFPYSFWINVGLDKNTNGQFDGELWNSGNNIVDWNSRNNFYLTNIKNTFESNNTKQFIKLYLAKTNIMYSQGDLGTAAKKFGISKKMGGFYQVISGAYNDTYIIYIQVIYLVILIFCLIYCINRFIDREKSALPNYMDFLAIFFIGIYMFHIFMWEVMPRYSFVSLLAILPMAALGIKETDSDLCFQVKKNYIFSFILLSLVFIIVGHHLSGQKRNIAKEKVVISQIAPFHMYKPLTIPAGKYISEKIYVPHNFKKIKIIYWTPNVPLESQPRLKMSIYDNSGNDISNKNEKNSGTYILRVKNISSKPTEIAVTRCNNIDLMQEPIRSEKGTYLNFKVID